MLPTYAAKPEHTVLRCLSVPGNVLTYLEFFVSFADSLAVRFLPPTMPILAKEAQSLPVEKKQAATCALHSQLCTVVLRGDKSYVQPLCALWGRSGASCDTSKPRARWELNSCATSVFFNQLTRALPRASLIGFGSTAGGFAGAAADSHCIW